jgi:cytidylate kinase
MDLRQLIGSLRSAGDVPGGAFRSGFLPAVPFVTISRQAGAGGITLGHALAEHLNKLEPSEHPWQCFDRELVERIAADHNLSADLVRSLESSSHTWISEFLGGLSHSDRTPSELAVFRRVVETMRALARAGHVILVGLGGVLITRDMPRGAHVRVIAPFEYRVRHLAKTDQISERDARARVKLLDHDRQAYFRKFWPGTELSSELFHLTLNSGMMAEADMAACLADLVKERVPENV